ncbi:ABC transporter transmembrane region-domain-containing protein [Mycena polygramma]|nr:ABC transporter transmembrane region-domain-containing protein [Mycena polygramma]
MEDRLSQQDTAVCLGFGCAFCQSGEVASQTDLLPLATFTGVPADLDEGPTLWAKIAVLLITAVMIPLFTPRQYIPVDPSNPAKAVNPEQTASIFSFALYFFLDHIIFLAHRESRLDEDELYPLCDTDASAHLKNQSFKYLDRFSGKKSQQHIFVGFMRFFRREVTLMVVLILLKVVTTISGQAQFPRKPFAMNRLLRYIETQDQEADVRPWAWILVIFLAPVVGLIGDQLSAFINTRSLVRADAIITQLVFAHSLRIRVKAETTANDASAVETSPSDTPPASTASTTRAPTPQNPESSRSNNVSPALRGGVKSASAEPAPQPVKAESKKPEGTLVGKINNLVTVDLANIVDGWDSLQLLASIPLQIAASVWFIHSLLGWSVWVGAASVLLLVPVPGHMAKLVQSVQQERLKRTDERVQSVSEAVNVLRMVKLFGWEEKMKDRIAEKRDAELVWIRKKRVLDMVAGFVNNLMPVSVLFVPFKVICSECPAPLRL